MRKRRLTDYNALSLARLALGTTINKLKKTYTPFVPLYMEAYFMIRRMERVALEQYLLAKPKSRKGGIR